jgi:hypothetical protein
VVSVFSSWFLDQRASFGEFIGMDDFVRTHDLERLKTEFGKLKRPKRGLREVVDAVAGVLDGVSIEGVKLGPLAKLFRDRATKLRVEAACWRWLRPHPPLLTAGGLLALQSALGLQDLTHGEFCRRLRECCRQHAQDYSRLSRFIDARIGEIEFNLREAPRTPSHASRNFEVYQRQLLAVAYDQSTRPAQAIDPAQALPGELLAACSEALAAVLDQNGGEGSTVDANLMVPVDRLDDLGDLRSSAGARTAEWLWNGLKDEPHQYFVVVAETRGSDYAGFWVPDVRPGGNALPGAARAFQVNKPQAVFVDDLPPFPVSDEEIGARWRKYLRGEQPGHFTGRQFVSLPVNTRVALDQFIPAGVINVNVQSDHPWFWAYSDCWLEEATRAVSHWISSVWHAFGIALSVRAATLVEGEEVTRPKLLPDVCDVRERLKCGESPVPQLPAHGGEVNGVEDEEDETS